MFLKNSNKVAPPSSNSNAGPALRKTIPCIITSDVKVLGNIAGDAVIDFDGSIDGNIRGNTVTIRKNAMVRGEIEADTVHVYGTIKGIVRAKSAHFYNGCNMQGIIMHQGLSIEDGAFVDGKFKRTDKTETNESDNESGGDGFLEFKPESVDNLRLVS